MMTCPHRPVSNGWSGSPTSGATTWCGRCKENVAVDVEWANAYYDREQRQVQRKFDDVLQSVERDRTLLIQYIEQRRVTAGAD